MRSVLVTGAGRGIGYAVAKRLAATGWHVYAGVREIASGDKLVHELGPNVTPLILDVTDAAQIESAVEQLPGQLEALVNNAGIAINAPVESVPIDELRRQFEVNVFGTIAVTQAVLPKIRAAKGRVVFISSISGRIATPWSGPYCGSKFALEALVDALRMEVNPWGIEVSLVEPSATDTDMWGEILVDFDATVGGLAPEQRNLYATHTKGMRRTLKTMQKTTVSPEHVVKCVERALTAKRPRARYPVGVPSRVQLAASAVTPTRVNDFVLSRATGIPRKR